MVWLLSRLNNGKKRERLNQALTVLDRFAVLTTGKISLKISNKQYGNAAEWKRGSHYILERSIYCLKIVAMIHDNFIPYYSSGLL